MCAVARHGDRARAGPWQARVGYRTGAGRTRVSKMNLMIRLYVQARWLNIPSSSPAAVIIKSKDVPVGDAAPQSGREASVYFGERGAWRDAGHV